MESRDLERMLQELFASQGLAVLATQGKDGPHASLVAFAATDDLGSLVFATARGTRKYANLSAHPRVALLVDDRSHRAADLVEATAVTAEGHARESHGDERERLAERLLGKHPALRPFIAQPGCALIAVTVRTYQVVTRFQSVIEFCPTAYT